MNKTSSRIVVFDLLRIALIFLIVNIHIRILTQPFSNILSPFEYLAVPLFVLLSFFLMSKYFLQNNLSSSSLLSRLKRLFVPFLFWSFVGFLPNIAIFTYPTIVLQLITGEVVNVPLYYLILVMLFTLLFWIATFIPYRVRMTLYIFLLVGCFSMQYSLWNYDVFHVLSLPIRNSYGRFLELLPYAIMGLLIGTEQVKKNISLLFIGIFLLLISFVFHFPTPAGFHYQGLVLFMQSVGIFSCVLLMRPFLLTSSVSTIIESLGKYSFGLYLFHYTLLESLTGLFPTIKLFMVAHSIIFLFLYVALCYTLCFLIAYVTRKKFAYLFT